MTSGRRNSFADYKADAHNWITLTAGEYYPDILQEACQLYEPVLEMFGQLLRTSESSVRLLIQISEVPSTWMRVQLFRVFRKYVSPEIPVEMLKRKKKAREICDRFGVGFRPVQEVQAAYMTRPIPDEAMSALLWEYKSRGKKGYDLTERFFSLFRLHFPYLTIEGPERAGKDIMMGNIFANYPNPKRPVDFAIYDINENDLLAIGLARYDSDRGGAQEDDRTGGYRSCLEEILNYTRDRNLRTKIIFLNDGPGLLLGSMWDDYANIENSWPGRIMVLTLRMVPDRITVEWLRS
ncbi:MAG: bstEII [Oscillatoriales cyanobacterium RU_3_3]|nr:bstEII [Oscillatoriales cyanobacterium RU_3_3]NJR22507.1 bstEII [Richelia sp. CSU_2_1]